MTRQTQSTKAASFNLRVLLGFFLCAFGLLLAVAGFGESVTGTIVSTPDSTKWYVNGVNGSDSNDCKSSTTACKTIGHAISLAASGDSILVAAATYPEHLTVGVGVKLTGSNAKTTIIDGGGGGRAVIILSGAQVTLSNFTVQNGAGGINNSGTLAINRCSINDNHVIGEGSLYGGGIYNNGSLTINNSTLSGNSINSFFHSISAFGGGIYNTGTLIVNNSTLSGNSAITIGLYQAHGGGIYNAGTLTVNSSTLSGNSASSSNGTIPGIGGNVYSSNNGAVFQNSIVANTPIGLNCAGTIISDGYNLCSDDSCGFSHRGDLNNTDPLLGPLQDNGGPTETMALLAGSPAIDAGNRNGCGDGQGHLFKTDQRHEPRPDPEDTGGCDMGAYEYQDD